MLLKRSCVSLPVTGYRTLPRPNGNGGRGCLSLELAPGRYQEGGRGRVWLARPGRKRARARTPLPLERHVGRPLDHSTDHMQRDTERGTGSFRRATRFIVYGDPLSAPVEAIALLAAGRP